MNSAFRYLDQENLLSAENKEHLEQILDLPIDEAIELTDDELDETVKEGLDD